jgi:NAD(P)-dependent dehydrogenase (short-subunit alcohol dehydrogenase family)
MTKRMIRRGARHIVLLSRSGKITDDLRHLMEDAKSYGASVYVKACDVADEKSVQALVEESKTTLPPVRGVIHAAMVLKVSLLMIFAIFTIANTP